MAACDTDACAERCNLRRTTVASEAELLSSERHGRHADRPRSLRVAIKADPAMAGKILRRFREPEPLRIAAVRKQAELHRTDAARDERFLRRARHPDCDIGIATEEVLITV
jgi:hypothetical protein